jgi:peptidyl-prolyl isomerase G (cyclophilin G)
MIDELSLGTGEMGIGKNTAKPLHYRNTPFHRIISGFMCQGGDFSNKNGTGGESIYGGKFSDENFVKKHDRPALLSMANSGPNTNGSQFFITLRPTPHLDGKHVVFGELISGLEVLRRMERVSTGVSDKPVFGEDVVITNCGVVSLPSIETSEHEGREKHVSSKKSKKKKDQKKKKKKKDSKKEDKKKSKKRRRSRSESSRGSVTAEQEKRVRTGSSSS